MKCVICGKPEHRDVEGMLVHCPELGMTYDSQRHDVPDAVSLKVLNFLE